MRAHCLQHVPFEGLGSIEPWLKAAGYEITNTRFFEAVKLPDVHRIDLLIVMGGPMSANDESEIPWLVLEKQFIRDAIQLGKSVIGLQFHLETTPKSAQEIVTNCREELQPSQYVQSEPEILAAYPESYRTINNLMGRVLSFLTGIDLKQSASAHSFCTRLSIDIPRGYLIRPVQLL